MSSQEKIKAAIAKIESLLLEKNLAYGDSVFNPVRIFSKGNPLDQLASRIDDKLSRMARGQGKGEDTLLDLIGYLVLFMIAKDDEKTTS